MDQAPDVTSIDDDIQDVSLIDTPVAEPTVDTPSEPAEQGTEQAADTQDTPSQEQQTETNDSTVADTQQSRDERVAAAQKAYQERQRTKQQVAQQLDTVYGPKTEEDLINEGFKPADAQIQALREEMAYERQRTQIAEMNANLQSEAVNVLNDFDVYNPNSGNYDPEFTNQVQEAYKTAARLQTDDSGIVLNAEVPIYDFYQRMANIYSRGATKGQEQAQRDTVQMLGRTESIGGSSSETNRGTSLDDLEERLGNVVIT